jgi:hypothetical protein
MLLSLAVISLSVALFMLCRRVWDTEAEVQELIYRVEELAGELHGKNK